MSSTFFLIGRLVPQEWCLRLYVQEARLKGGMTLDLLRDGLAVSWIGEPASLDRARHYASTVVAAYSFFHPQWKALTLTPQNWVEAQGVEAEGRIAGFFDSALAMGDIHPEENKDHEDNQPFREAAEFVRKADLPLHLAMQDWHQGMLAYWSRDPQQRLEVLFHTYRAIEVLAQYYTGQRRRQSGTIWTHLNIDENEMKKWKKDYADSVRHGDWDARMLHVFQPGDTQTDRRNLRDTLTNSGPHVVINQFIKMWSLS